MNRFFAPLFTTIVLCAAAGNLFAADFPISLPPVFEADRTFYLAPNGDDHSDGSAASPFATLEKAVAAVEEFRRFEPEKSVAVSIDSGEYIITKPVVFDSLKASPDKPIVFRRAVGAKENPVFAGGKKVFGWEKLAGSEFWQSAPEAFKKRVRSEALNKIFVAPYDDYATDVYDPAEYGQRQELFSAGVPQTLARWPNTQFAHAGKALGATNISSWASHGTKEGIFEAADDQPTGWNDEPNALLFGYWFWDWSDSFAKLKKMDDDAKIIEVKEPFDFYGYKNDLRYYGFNLLCELDRAGEYYIDRDVKKIFWIPPVGIDPNENAPEIATFPWTWMVEMKNCDSLVLAGLTFDMGFGGAANIENCDNILLADSVFRRFGRDAIHIKGGKNCGVYSCRLETLGCGGISIQGGDRMTLTDGRHFVSETTVRNFSRIKRTYAPAVLAEGCGMKFDHNDFSGSSSSAMRLEGNEFLVEYSRFHELVEESDDQGAIDVYYNPTYRGNIIRFNHWSNIVGGTHCGAAAIRFDDMISGYTVYGNVFVHCGAVNFGAVQIHGGKENTVENNVFLDCRAVASFSSWGNRYTRAFTDPASDDYAAMKKKCYEEVNIDSDVWKSRYPTIENIAAEADTNTVRDNLAVNTEELFLRAAETTRLENNTQLTLEGAEESQITVPEFLVKYGLKPIPVEQMGPTETPYLSD